MFILKMKEIMKRLLGCSGIESILLILTIRRKPLKRLCWGWGTIASEVHIREPGCSVEVRPFTRDAQFTCAEAAEIKGSSMRLVT